MTTKALAATCWLAALIAVAAAATQHQTAMGISGLVGVVAAIAWGLVRWLEDDADDEWWYWADYEMRAYREQVWARREGGPPFNIEDVFALRNQKWDNAPDPTDPRSYGVWDDNEPELPYRAPIRTENIYRGPVWPNETGSVE